MSPLSRRFACALFTLALGGCSSQDAEVTSDAATNQSASDYRQVDCSGPCDVDNYYGISTDGLHTAGWDWAQLSPPANYRHIAFARDPDGGAWIAEECKPALPMCGQPGAVSLCDLVQDIADPVVQGIIMEAAISVDFTVSFGMRASRESNAFAIQIGDRRKIFVSPEPCSSDSCRSVPPAIERLVDDLKKLDEEAIHSPECTAIGIPIHLVGVMP
jgi:hypothetical protein